MPELSSIIQQPIIDDLIAHGHCEIRRGLSASFQQGSMISRFQQLNIRLMEEILQRLGCIKPCKWWDALHINWCRISSINSMFKKVLQTSENGRHFFSYIYSILAYYSILIYALLFTFSCSGCQVVHLHCKLSFSQSKAKAQSVWWPWNLHQPNPESRFFLRQSPRQQKAIKGIASLGNPYMVTRKVARSGESHSFRFRRSVNQVLNLNDLRVSCGQNLVQRDIIE